MERESHYLWGRRYLLSAVERDAKPTVRLSHRRITLAVRPGTAPAKRAIDKMADDRFSFAKAHMSLGKCGERIFV